ncbi:CopD family protein [Castellaniella sp.]|uniref:CopD family protein n=1 Tax=Castellaniella sp. TaxID=1955812 RepID=UPI002AFFAB8B|nr:CopD family protein [Castellaniella sp.]
MLWVKTFHILFVVSWFAGLFYLPRIYVNLAQADDPAVRASLLGMAARLYRFMTPLGVLALILGSVLWLHYGIGQGQGWLHAKLLAVLGLIVFHLACRQHLRTFIAGTNRHGHRYFRWFNEIPVLLLLLTLILVVVKPF